MAISESAKISPLNSTLNLVLVRVGIIRSVIILSKGNQKLLNTIY